MAIRFHEGDLPPGVLAPGPLAVDTETMGLMPGRDRLCLVQISDVTQMFVECAVDEADVAALVAAVGVLAAGLVAAQLTRPAGSGHWA